MLQGNVKNVPDLLRALYLKERLSIGTVRKRHSGGPFFNGLRQRKELEHHVIETEVSCKEIKRKTANQDVRLGEKLGTNAR